MTNTNKPWHTNYERIRVRVLSNISEIFAKKNHEYEQRKNAKIFVRAKSIACRPWSEALLNGFAFDELTLASRHHLVHDKVECSKWKSLQHLKFIMHAGI